MHELTHASEPAPFKNIKQTALPREFRGKDIEGYYNNPHEVRAYMQEIVLYFVSKWKKAHLPTELNRFLAKWKEDLPDNLRQSLHYMTPENRNKIWSAVFRALQNRS